MFKIVDKKRFVFFVVSVIVIICAILWALYWALTYKKNNSSAANEAASISKESQKNSFVPTLTDEVVVQTDSSTKKVKISTGEISEASALEQENFSSYAGFPKLGDDSGRDSEQSSVLTSFDATQSIVTVDVYDSSDPKNQDNPPILSSSDYLCNVQAKTCQPSEILSQAYQGLDPALQKTGAPFAWSKWDSGRNLIFGHLSLSDKGDSSPVYICDTQKKSCDMTIGFDSTKEGDTHAVVPGGAFSPMLDKFVMISQNDDPNNVTGKKWDLLLYNVNDLSKPLRDYDISSIIDTDSRVAYDSVYSVSWSGDEKQLAIGTSRRIFMFGFDSGSLSLVYVAPTDADGNYYWDTSSLFLTPDAKFIAFVDSTDDSTDDSADPNSAADDPVNILKKIDLENGNNVSAMYSGKGLSLQL